MAAYDMLDNKLCGDWQGLPKCPEMEAGLYEKYADKYPDSPKAAQALYEATYREGVLVSMYQVEENRKRSEQAAANTQALAAAVEAAVSTVGLCGAGGEHCVSRGAGHCGVRK